MKEPTLELNLALPSELNELRIRRHIARLHRRYHLPGQPRCLTTPTKAWISRLRARARDRMNGRAARRIREMLARRRRMVALRRAAR